MCSQMKSPVHAVTPSNQGAISGVESEVQSDLGEQELFIGTVTSAPRVAHLAWFLNLLVGGTPIKFKLETGAEANVLPLSVYAKLRENCEACARGVTANLPFFVAAVESPPPPFSLPET